MNRKWCYVDGVFKSIFCRWDNLFNCTNYGAAGATVPIIGFGHTLAEGVKKAIDTDGFIGIFTGGTIATAGGIAAAIFFGYTMAVLFKSKPKP